MTGTTQRRRTLTITAGALAFIGLVSYGVSALPRSETPPPPASGLLSVTGRYEYAHGEDFSTKPPTPVNLYRLVEDSGRVTQLTRPLAPEALGTRITAEGAIQGGKLQVRRTQPAPTRPTDPGYQPAAARPSGTGATAPSSTATSSTGTAAALDTTTTTSTSTSSTGTMSTMAATGAPAVTRKTAVAVIAFTASDWGGSSNWANVTGSMNTTMFGASGSVARYYKEATDGTLTLAGDVLGPFVINQTVSYSSTPCAWDTWGLMARDVAATQGIDLKAYQNVVFVWSGAFSTCGFSGIARMGSGDAYMNGTFDLGVVAHEVGHNLSMGHASTLNCGAATYRSGCLFGGRSSGGSPGTWVEYGDMTSVMGSHSTVRLPGAFQTAEIYHKIAGCTGSYDTYCYTKYPEEAGTFAPTAGLPPGFMQTIGTGTYTVYRTHQGSYPQLLALPRGLSRTATYLDLRSSYGSFDTFPGTDPFVNGVSVHLGNSMLSSWDNSVLLDGTPSTAGNFSDAPLRAGTSFTDPESGYQVTVNGIDATSATVTVTKPLTDTTPPAAPTGLTLTSADQYVLKFKWNPSTDNQAVAGYEILVNGVLYSGGTLYTYYAGDRIYCLNNVCAGSTSNQGSTLQLTPGTTYDVTVRAFDVAGNRSPGITAKFTAAEAVPPTAPTGVTAAPGPSADSVTLTWSPSTDASGIMAYEPSCKTTELPAYFAATVGATSTDLRWWPVGNDTIWPLSQLSSFTVADGTTASMYALPPTARSATITGLAPGLQLSCQVVAYDSWRNVSQPGSTTYLSPGTSDKVGTLGTPTEYRLTRDGVLLATVPASVTRTNYSDTAAAGTHLYTLQAADAAGNRSPSVKLSTTVGTTTTTTTTTTVPTSTTTTVPTSTTTTVPTSTTTTVPTSTTTTPSTGSPGWPSGAALSATVQSKAVNLSWPRAVLTANGTTTTCTSCTYKLIQSTKSQSKILASSLTGTAFTVSGLRSGTYTFTVYALNGGMMSATTLNASVTL